MLYVNKTWRCRFSQVGGPRAACFHSACFQPLGTTTREAESDSHFATRCACILFPSTFCSVWTVRLGFYFPTVFPAFLSLCCRTPHQGRQAVSCPVCCHGIIWKAREATTGKRRCFPPVSQALGRLSMSRSVSLKGQELPAPLFPR